MLLVLALALFVCPAPRAESPAATDDAGLAAMLGFEGEPAGSMPAGWGGGPPATIFADNVVKHTGRWAARIERTPGSPQEFSTLTKSLPMGFQGRRIELRGFVRTEDVSGFAGLWLREDGPDGSVEFDNMQRHELKGTTEWTEYSITLPVNPDGRKLYFGFLLHGTGKAWVDDLQLLVDGRPVWNAPRAEPIETILDRDHEFDEGSKIALTEVTPVQVANLATLARVWGFLKYHQPQVTSGRRHWDYELFRVMPAVLAAPDQAGANAVLRRWVEGLGELQPDANAAPEEPEIHLRPDLAWIGDEALLGKELSGRLQAVRAALRPAGGQFYVSLVPGVGNPVFAHEQAYPRLKLPDPGYQLLALFRLWNIIRYWSPYRDLIGDDWDAVLTEFIPRVGLAGGADAYQLELLALIARVHDTHANLWSSLNVRPPVGDSRLPATLRMVEGRPVVTDVAAGSGESSSGLQRGDVICAIGDRPIEELVRGWSPYYAASNEPTRLRDIARFMGRGPAGPVRVRVQRGRETVEVDATRVPSASLPRAAPLPHDLPGPAFRLLSREVAYLKLSAVKAADAASYVDQAAGTKGWIIDARNYPSEFVVFALGAHLVDQPTEFARFTIGDLRDPGTFSFTKPLLLTPQAPHYAGRVVILVDEVTWSQAEYTTMAFRVAPGALVVGSTTAAADGNVSRIPLPGSLHTLISGIGVFYPDKRPTQRIGIVPDVEVKPTLDGVRAGRDEVLEAALRQILGPQAPAEEISQLARVRE